MKDPVTLSIFFHKMVPLCIKLICTRKKGKKFHPLPPKGPKNPHFLVFRGFSPVAPLILLGSKIWQGANFKPSKKPFERNFKIQNRPIGSRVISKNVTFFAENCHFRALGLYLYWILLFARPGELDFAIFLQHIPLFLVIMCKKFCADYFSGFRDIGIWINTFFARLG